MKISEQQIMSLIQIAQNVLHDKDHGDIEYRLIVSRLLDEIAIQQSTELKEINVNFLDGNE